jgi:glycosyltransferase involved in cell wall biosynthesis
MIYLAVFIIVFAVIRLIVVVSNYGQCLKKSVSNDTPLVSVLIPARNEEQNIGRILDDLMVQDYTHFEVWVYDDLSSDDTYAIAASYARKDSRIQVIKGKELPDGWIGKNHGCHNLALHAKGEYLLYLDADVQISKGMINSVMNETISRRLDLLSIFPAQVMLSLSEWLTVPLMNWILVSLLPLKLIRESRFSSLSAANGQFMLFKADVYHKEQFHKALKNKNVEDIAISRLMKEKGYKIQTLLGNSEIRCRMYRSWPEAVQGFSRNMFYFFGGSKMATFGFALITILGFIPILLSLPLKYVFFYFSVIIMIRVFVSLWSRQNIPYNLFLAPFQQLTFLFIIVRAAMLQFKKATRWKGRLIDK